MNKFLVFKLIISILLLIVSSIPVVKGAILYVDQSGSCPGAYLDVTSAIQMAPPGSTLYLCSNILETRNLVDLNVSVVIEGNGYNWFIEDQDVTDVALRISNNAEVSIENVNLTLYDATSGLMGMGIDILPGATLNLSSSNLTIFLEQSSSNSYGLFFRESSRGYIEDSSLYIIGLPTYIQSTSISVFNSNLRVIRSTINGFHHGRVVYLVSNLPGVEFIFTGSKISSPFGMGISAVSSTVPVLSSLDITIENSTIDTSGLAFSAISDQGSSVDVEISNSLIYSDVVGIDVRAGGPFSALPSTLNMGIKNVRVYIVSNEAYQQGISVYGISGLAYVNARNLSIYVDTLNPVYTLGLSFIIGGRFIGGPRGNILGELKGVDITGPLYGVGVYPYRPFSFGGGGGISIDGEDIYISDIETGILIGFDQYTLNQFGISSISSDSLYVNTTFENVRFGYVEKGLYIGRVEGEYAFYDISLDTISFESPARTAGIIVNNTSSSKNSMNVSISGVRYSGSSPYKGSPGLVSHADYPYSLMVSYSVIGYMMLDGLANHPISIIESVYDEVNSQVSPILTPYSTWTLGINVVDGFSVRPVRNAFVQINNSSNILGVSNTNTNGYTEILLSYIYNSVNPQTPQFVITASKAGVSRSLNYSQVVRFYTLPSWYRNITINLSLGMVNAYVYGDLGEGYLNIEGYTGEFRVGSLLSMWLFKYDIQVKSRVLFNDILIISSTLSYKGVSLEGYIFVNLRYGYLYIRYGAIEMWGYLL